VSTIFNLLYSCNENAQSALFLTAGLDVSSRKLIADLLGRLHEARSPRIVLILRPQDEIPSWVDNIIQMGLSNTQNPAYSGAKSAWTPRDTGNSASTKQETSQRRRSNAGDPETFTIRNANVKYHDRHILKDISWKLRAGDRAVLTGANGKTDYISDAIQFGRPS
jgi:ABC-type Mn2+/Zn2+ transport system ATPase subunit